MGQREWLTDVFGSYGITDQNVLCFRVTSDDMEGKDGYNGGDVVVIHIGATPVPGKDVVIKIPEGKFLFRRLQEDADGLYLLALKTNAITRLQDKAEIYGVAFVSGRTR